MDDPHIGVIGLGYVGLPLAVAFGKLLPTTGFDIQTERVDGLRNGYDKTLEVSAEELAAARWLRFTAQQDELSPCNVYIVSVPTPVNAHKHPDLGPLLRASETVAQVLSKGNVVVFESTVYPGATEEVCVPVLERGSGLSFNTDFTVGYSPERINPGDKEHRLASIVKITSGSNPATLAFVDALYQRIIQAGTHPVSSIRVAEAAKVIENIQRDINIALMNELSMLFNLMEIDTGEVLAAAGSKWNFLKFQPGLVGGHCIGVDPYYLTHKAQELGYFPEMILAGRRINDRMGAYVANRVIQAMTQKNISLVNAQVLVMGLAFKENCPDLRNTLVVSMITELHKFGLQVSVYDPWVDPEQGRHEYGLELIPAPEPDSYHAIVLAVAHREFVAMGAERIRNLGRPGAVLFDVKQVLPPEAVDGRL
ncbi:MAG: nucleotide sugar dehydrogenase [Magnetococcales bacterium]|nr:nucleotide sugar dehydrogenase [Magnetococcales bacterium]MBF0582726.1 nucleotide sugar dehydrogenase [Magnetococcales bacterium]